MDTEKHITNSEIETYELGNRFASKLQEGDTVALYGDLGAGKTQFIKGICSYFKVNEIVNSPTFTIINQYSAKKNGSQIPIYHIDLYRINNTKELEEIGFVECLQSGDAIKLIEWSEKAGDKLFNVNYKIKFILDPNNENYRNVVISFLE